MKYSTLAATLLFASHITLTHAAKETPADTQQAPEPATEEPWAIKAAPADPVCYHAGDRNGFETCTTLDHRDCERLKNGTLICEVKP
jgi:hypothetical protein